MLCDAKTTRNRTRPHALFTAGRRLGQLPCSEREFLQQLRVARHARATSSLYKIPCSQTKNIAVCAFTRRQEGTTASRARRDAFHRDTFRARPRLVIFALRVAHGIERKHQLQHIPKQLAAAKERSTPSSMDEKTMEASWQRDDPSESVRCFHVCGRI